MTRTFRTGRRRTSRRQVVALASVDLTIERGEVHGLLGPNGAGKTTLVKILSTILLHTSGHVAVLGHDVVKATNDVRRRIGIVLGGERGLHDRLTPAKTLRYWAALYRLPPAEGEQRARRLLERVGLERWADTRIETFSRGMKQRLHLARGLISDPGVLFLDEPTTGMDPVAAWEFRQLVRELRSDGRSILLTMHDMDEAEELCDRVSLIDGGRILATDTPERLAARLGHYDRVDAVGVDAETAVAMKAIPGVASVTS